MLDWIKKGHEGYLLDDAKARYDVMELDGEGYLVLNWDAEKLWLNFAVLTFRCSASDGSDTELDVQFYGEGPSGALKECRHTYWGEEGYLFYPNGKAITAGLKELSKYYDDLK